ncbi:type VII secretion protein EccB [Paractinoplanes rishiriensis]|uniref:Type VII secretion protein EccB n=1 Tax=Paractinoplanes rishiriensis TaxID=1050105 RepID=A0A919KAM4_9ACTN|nr:type VII secretion protein EccB [Actinoplanes rishiriensis]GIF01599.1 type VII secretion protein EccB [Actinoplanes rishiriensis]
MATRQDQVHSYQYAVQRVVSALVAHDPDPARSPLRRAGTTALVGMLVAALAVGGVAIYGLLTGNNAVNPRDPSVIFQEKGTGAQYVYLAADQRLHPVLNYTSALLLTDNAGAQVRSVSAKRLSGVPLGPVLGIPGAPDSLPARDQLRRNDWSVCTRTADSGPRTTVVVGASVPGGTSVTTAGRALLVSAPSGESFLVHGNRRFAIPREQESATRRALGWETREPWPVGTAWINAIPTGPELRAPSVPPSGQPSGIVDGLRTGQLVTDAQRTQTAVLLDDGIAAITDVQSRLLQAQEGASAPEPVANFLSLPPSKTRLGGDQTGLPGTVPALAPPMRSACVTVAGREPDRLNIQADPTVPAGTLIAGNDRTADEVYVPRATGVVATPVATPGVPATTGVVVIVTDNGVAYPLASKELLPRLGYNGVTPTVIPAQMLTLLAAGPSLDQTAARRSAQAG